MLTKILFKFKKEFILLLIVLLVIISMSTYLMHIQAQKVLVHEHFDQLNSVKNTLRVNIQNYFKTTQNILLSLAASQTSQDATAQFEYAYEQIKETKNEPIDTVAMKKYVENTLKRTSYDMPGSQPKQSFEAYVPKTYTNKILHNLYIYNNPFDEGEKYRLQGVKNGLLYDEVHEKFHPYFTRELQKYGLHDIFIIDLMGNIVYTVFKENDFATNIVSGIYSNSGLARVYKKAKNASKNEIVFEDFAPFEPSFNQPASFLATPIYNKDIKIGVLVFQLPIEEINKIMTIDSTQEASGLGKTGEAYLVGPDFLMRSDSRFIKKIDNKYVKKFSSTVGIIKADTPAVRKALAGINSQELSRDYRDLNVYSSFEPLKIFGIQWAILVEVDKNEVDDEIYETTVTLFMTALIVFIVVLFMIVFLCIKFLLRPMQQNEELLNDNLRLKNKALLISESLLSEYKRAVDLSAIVSKSDSKGVITYVNDEFCKISGYSKEELIGKPHSIIRHPEMSPKIFKELWHTILQKRVWKGIIKNLNKDGSAYYVNSTIIPMVNEDKEISQFISIRTDVTDLILKEEQILRQTMCPITLLPNKLKLLEDIKEMKNEAKLATLFINDFLDIYDFYGKRTAHKILKQVAVKLSYLVDEYDIKLYKIADYEFTLLAKESMVLKEFEKLILEIIDYFDQEVIAIDDNSFTISITAGIASSKANRLFLNTQTALRKALELSRSSLTFENSSVIKSEYQKNIDMTVNIKNAIKEDNIVVFVQAISANKITKKDKYECLVRMKDHDKIISPFFFLEIAKKARLYPKLTHIVIEKSFEYFKDKDCEFSINLVLDDILREDTVSFLKRKINEYKIGHKLVIEIVESEGIEEFESVNEFILSLKSMGCKIAIDDFGTGYSNFEYLMKLNTDYIKIDGSLIKNVDTDEEAQLVVKLIVDFARRLDLEVIAEYVHNKAVQDKVMAMDIDYSQGYFIEEPKEIILHETTL
jgi:PAS domain S-box-containing protein